MKRIVAIVRPEKLEQMKEALFAADVSGMTITQVMGCGNQHGWSEFYRGTEVLLDGLAKLEYRGYDSAGLAFVSGSRFRRRARRCGGGRLAPLPPCRTTPP